MAEMQAPIRRKPKTDHLAPWMYKPGVSGNPGGKKKGTVNLKTRVQNMLFGMSDKEVNEFLHGLNKMDIWKMAEGTPQADITSGGKPIEGNTIVVKRYGTKD